MHAKVAVLLFTPVSLMICCFSTCCLITRGPLVPAGCCDDFRDSNCRDGRQQTGRVSGRAGGLQGGDRIETIQPEELHQVLGLGVGER